MFDMLPCFFGGLNIASLSFLIVKHVTKNELVKYGSHVLESERLQEALPSAFMVVSVVRVVSQWLACCFFAV